MQTVSDFATEWSDYVRRHNQGQTTPQEDQRMQQRRQEILALGTSANNKAQKLQTQLSNLTEYSEAANKDYSRLQQLRTQLDQEH
jgi:hypothetical protein